MTTRCATALGLQGPQRPRPLRPGRWTAAAPLEQTTAPSKEGCALLYAPPSSPRRSNSRNRCVTWHHITWNRCVTSRNRYAYLGPCHHDVVGILYAPLVTAVHCGQTPLAFSWPPPSSSRRRYGPQEWKNAGGFRTTAPTWPGDPNSQARSSLAQRQRTPAPQRRRRPPQCTDANRVAEQRHRHEPRGRCSLAGMV
jgi:hypothetical protein